MNTFHNVFISLSGQVSICFPSSDTAQGLKRLMSRITELHQEIKEVGVSPWWLCWGTSPGKPCENMRESEEDVAGCISW